MTDFGGRGVFHEMKRFALCLCLLTSLFLATGPARAENPPVQNAQEQIDDLNKKADALRGIIADTAKDLKPDHPKMVELRGKLEMIQSALSFALMRGGSDGNHRTIDLEITQSTSLSALVAMLRNRTGVNIVEGGDFSGISVPPMSADHVTALTTLKAVHAMLPSIDVQEVGSQEDGVILAVRRTPEAAKTAGGTGNPAEDAMMSGIFLADETYLSPADLAHRLEMLNGVAALIHKAGGLTGEQFKATAPEILVHEATNYLIVRATRNDLARISEAIRAFHGVDLSLLPKTNAKPGNAQDPSSPSPAGPKNQP